MNDLMEVKEQLMKRIAQFGLEQDKQKRVCLCGVVLKDSQINFCSRECNRKYNKPKFRFRK